MGGPRQQAAAWALFVLAQGALAGTNTEGLEFLKENKEREGVVELPSGLQYEVLATGSKDGPHPNATSPCVCHYKGTLLNGDVFDSSYSRGSPTTFQPNQVVKGWTEALQLMRPGDKWKLFLPSELAYGDRGAGGKIPGGAVLIFELELLEVKSSFTSGLGDVVDRAIAYVRQEPMVLLLVIGGLYMLYQMFGGGGGGAGAKEQVKLADAAGAPENARVFMDIKIGDGEPERIEMVLFSKHYPKTAENFRALCTGEKGTGKSGKELTFKKSKFHRIIPGFMCQGGDFTAGNGTGGESIYGSKFADEWDSGFISHEKPFMLSMANAGPNTNGSQFFLTVAACKWLDGKHVVFGHVTEGVDTVKKMEAAGTQGGTPKQPVAIVDCGEVKSKAT